MIHILRTLDRRGAAVLIPLDLSAAFDTVDHSLLPDKMRVLHGFTGSAHDWVQSEWTQKVPVKISLSAPTCLNVVYPKDLFYVRYYSSSTSCLSVI